MCLCWISHCFGVSQSVYLSSDDYYEGVPQSYQAVTPQHQIESLVWLYTRLQGGEGCHHANHRTQEDETGTNTYAPLNNNIQKY